MDGSKSRRRILGGFWRVFDSLHLEVEIVDIVEFLEEVKGGFAVIDVDVRGKGVLRLWLEAESVGIDGWLGDDWFGLVEHCVDEVIGVCGGR